MRKMIIALMFIAVMPASAALVDNGSFTTDEVSGLDWLDLTETTALTVSDALVANNGWRLATNNEVEGLFVQLFDGYYETFATLGISRSSDNEYADQLEDINAFQQLFGINATYLDYYSYTQGKYYNENSELTAMGVSYTFGNGSHSVFGMNYVEVFDDASITGQEYGTYLVRSSVVPIPAAVWLFGSALAGLGWLRRKQTV